jgi:hypothetical protein
MQFVWAFPDSDVADRAERAAVLGGDLADAFHQESEVAIHYPAEVQYQSQGARSDPWG